MKINVSVKANAKKEEVRRLSKSNFEVRVKEEPVAGKANKKALRLLADYFKVTLADTEIVFGKKGRKKVVKVKDDKSHL